MNGSDCTRDEPRPADRTGARWMVLILGLTLMGPVRPAAAQEDPPKLPTAEKVLDKTIAAQGGREAFEKLQSRVTKGTIELTAGPQRLKGTIERYEAAPDLRYVEVKLGQQATQLGTDGFVHWEKNQSEARILDGDEKEVSVRRSRFNALLHWRDLYDKVECVGKEKVEDRLCVKVVLTPRVGEPLTMYFDWKNGLPLASEEVRKNPQGELHIRELFEDYREVDGVKLPFRIRRTNTGGGQTSTLVYTFESIQHNTAPSERFDLPEEVKKLRESGGGSS